MKINTHTLGFLGFGNIGHSLYKGLKSKKLIEDNYIILTKNQKSLEKLNEQGFSATINVAEFWRNSDIVFFAPPSSKALLLTENVKDFIEDRKKVIISFCAGVSIENLQNNFSKNQHWIKAISNINIETNNGYIAVYNPNNNNKELDTLIDYSIKLLEGVGKLNQVDSENMCDIVSTSSGALPAFINVIIDGCIDGCIYGGIPKEMAKELVLDVFKGTASHLLQSKTPTSTLKQTVTSSGGVVIKGIKEFEKYAPRAAMIDGLSTVYDAINKMKSTSKIKNKEVIIIGGGIFGLTGAIELAERGYKVTILEKSESIPGLQAASKDRSKMIRIDYGEQRELIDLMLKSVEKWNDWNNEFDEKIFYQEGMLMMSGERFEDNPYNADAINFKILTEDYKIKLERFDSKKLVKRFPAWKSANVSKLYPDGYFNPIDGWCDSMLLMKLLKEKALKLNVKIHTNTKVAKIDFVNNKVKGVELEDGNYIKTKKVILAAGAWANKFAEPRLNFIPKAQAELYFSLKNSEQFFYPNFTMWAADVSKTGWGGFSALKDELHNGWIKIDHHGEGFNDIDVNGERDVPTEHIKKCRQFLSKTFPELEKAKLEEANICFYNDTKNKNFLIDFHPKYKGLFIASGGSGHSFKFAPLLGNLIANTFEKKKIISKRFTWFNEGDNAPADPLRVEHSSLEQ